MSFDTIRFNYFTSNTWVTEVLYCYSRAYKQKWSIPQVIQYYQCFLLLYQALVIFEVLINIGKAERHYMKGQLKILGFVITLLFTNISTTAQVSNM